eukprot:3881089-Rhodomonas_salina.1
MCIRDRERRGEERRDKRGGRRGRRRGEEGSAGQSLQGALRRSGVLCRAVPTEHVHPALLRTGEGHTS